MSWPDVLSQEIILAPEKSGSHDHLSSQTLSSFQGAGLLSSEY